MENEIGKAIQLLRINNRLSQDELAELSNLSSGYISLAEKGKRNLSLSALNRISKALNMPLFLLLFYAEKDNVNMPRQLKQELLYEVYEVMK